MVPENTAKWYDLWVAAVAADGMCARSGKAGTARFLGECAVERSGGRVVGGIANEG